MRIPRPANIYGAILLVFLSFSLLLAQPAAYKYSIPEKLRDGIKTSSLKAVGIEEDKIVAGTNALLAGDYPNIHSFLIFRQGKLVYENYFTGEDENRETGSIGVVKHSREDLHDIRSISKSVVALAVLRAHSLGKIKSLDQPIAGFFPEYSTYFVGEKSNITVRHLLTMSSGIEWNEHVPSTDPVNSSAQLRASTNRIEFILSKKMADKPGTVYNYSGASAQLLAEIVNKSTGMRIDRFTEEFLFKPLGISKFDWMENSTGYLSAAGGLRLRSRDVAKLGLLVMNRGKWDGKQIIPQKLIKEAVTPKIKVSEDADGWKTNYGYQMFLPTFPDRGKYYSLVEFTGNGGQKVLVDSETDLMVVITAGNYDRSGLTKSSFDILLDIVYPAINN